MRLPGADAYALSPLDSRRALSYFCRCCTRRFLRALLVAYMPDFPERRCLLDVDYAYAVDARFSRLRYASAAILRSRLIRHIRWR